MSGGQSLEEIQNGVGYHEGDTPETPTSSQEVAINSQPLLENEGNGESMESTPTQENF